MTAGIYSATIFAATAHGHQTRKYTGEPYICHPLAVAERVAYYGGTEAMQVTAILHDVLEDTDTTPEEIGDRFGAQVAGWVMDLSDQCEGPNRSYRKAAERDRLARCCHEVQTIKLFDMVDNTSSIVEHDPRFASVYLEEKEALVHALTAASPDAKDLAKAVLRLAKEKLAISGGGF